MISISDFRRYERMGREAMNLPCGERQRKSILELCGRMKEAEPQAFEVADDWIRRTLPEVTLTQYKEPFGEWWRSHYNCNPVMMARWRALVDLMGKTEVEVSIYAPMAIGIYVVLWGIYDEPQTTDDREPKRVHGLQPNAADNFEVPSYLQTELAEKMLNAVEGVRGNKGVAVLNRGVTPWEFSTYADFGEIAQQITGQLGVRMAWGAWAKLVGVNPGTLKMQYIRAKNGRKKTPLSWKRIANAIKAVK